MKEDAVDGHIAYKELITNGKIFFVAKPGRRTSSSYMAQQLLMSQGLLLPRIHDHTHLDILHSVGLLWTSYQADAETPN
jgi:hypothetical protein